jgi:hypothetical protein
MDQMGTPERSFQIGGYTCTVVVEVPRFGRGERWTTQWVPQPPRHLTEEELRQYRAERARVSKDLARLLEADRYG